MTRWIGPLLVLVFAFLAAHWATLAFAPSIIMDRAMAELAKRGVSQHDFTNPLRISPQTQAVVRSSPDLFYALCRYDLDEQGAVLNIEMAEWPAYQSLSFFDARTNNFATFRGTGQRVEVQLSAPGSGRRLSSPTARGVILIRRLAPTQESFEAAKEASHADRCEIARAGS